tara:strand:+ start:1271 stop:1507 length:237 start_codon:yes stop_codon:yes gene_type:complete
MLKEEMKGYIEEIERKSSQLEANNSTLTLYVKQLQTKLQELGSVVTQYEKTILVMAGRLQEKDAFISEQSNEINRRND